MINKKILLGRGCCASKEIIDRIKDVSVTEDLEQLALNAPVGCKVCYYLEIMGTQHADNMRKALAQPDRYKHTKLADVFINNNMKLSEAAVRRHRHNCLGLRKP